MAPGDGTLVFTLVGEVSEETEAARLLRMKCGINILSETTDVA